MTSLSLALGLGLGPRGGFDPVSLFADGSQGFIFDPSDITTLFQDSGGTTPVTAPGQNAVLMRDKSGRGNHATLTNVVYQVDGTGRPYFEFNGSTSSGVTPSFTPGTDKVQIFAGVRKLSDAATSVIVESSTNSSSNANTVVLFAPVAPPANNYGFRTKGSAAPATTTTLANFASPVTNVVTGIGEIATDVTTIRVNGSVAASSSVDQGSGNFGSYAFYIGSRGGSSLFFNGRIYYLCAHFGAVSAAQITQIEAIVNAKTGAY